MLPGMTMVRAGSAGVPPPPTRTYLGNAETNSLTNTFTFTNFAIGSAASDRIIVVCAGARSGNSQIAFSSVTIGGNAATKAVDEIATEENFNAIAGIFYLAVPSGTTATIVVTFAASVQGVGIDVFSLKGLGSATPSATQKDRNPSWDGTQDMTCTLAMPSNGVLIAVVSQANTAAISWASLAGCAADSDFTAEGAFGDLRLSSFGGTGLAANGALAVTATSVQSNSAQVAAAWA